MRPPTNEASDAELLRIEDAARSRLSMTVMSRRSSPGRVQGWVTTQLISLLRSLLGLGVTGNGFVTRRAARPFRGCSASRKTYSGTRCEGARSKLRARERLGVPTQVLADPGYEAVDERLSFPSAVLCAFANLPEPERELLVLRLVEDRSYREIAVRMNCTTVAARLRFSRSFRRLQLIVGGVQS